MSTTIAERVIAFGRELVHDIETVYRADNRESEEHKRNVTSVVVLVAGTILGLLACHFFLRAISVSLFPAFLGSTSLLLAHDSFRVGINLRETKNPSPDTPLAAAAEAVEGVVDQVVETVEAVVQGNASNSSKWSFGDAMKIIREKDALEGTYLFQRFDQFNTYLAQRYQNRSGAN